MGVVRDRHLYLGFGSEAKRRCIDASLCESAAEREQKSDLMIGNDSDWGYDSDSSFHL
jgi:hypothetical protein